MDSILTEVNDQAKKVGEVVTQILGGCLDTLDTYIGQVKQRFDTGKELTDKELDEIIRQIPIHLYYLNTVLQKCDLRKGLADENKSFKKNEAILTATGTVQEKTAKAEMACSEAHIVFLAYRNACGIISSKMESASELLNSLKKIQNRRIEEMRLTLMAKNGGSF